MTEGVIADLAVLRYVLWIFNVDIQSTLLTVCWYRSDIVTETSIVIHIEDVIVQ